MSIGGIIGSVAGGLISSRGASRAADAQAAAASQQMAIEQRMYDETVERFEPFLGAGENALAALQFELGLGPRPTFGGTPQEVVEFQDSQPNNWTSEMIPGSEGDIRYVNTATGATTRRRPDDFGQTTTNRYRVGDQVFDTRSAADEYAAANPTGAQDYQGFQKTPGYDFQLGQGLDAIDNSAASRGNVFSGATMKAAQTFGQGLANQEYGNYLNRLTGLAGSGQAAAGNAANAGANFAAGTGNALANLGNAQAAGYIGQANAINSGINNAVGIWNYQNQRQNTGNTSGGFLGNLFG